MKYICMVGKRPGLLLFPLDVCIQRVLLIVLNRNKRYRRWRGYYASVGRNFFDLKARTLACVLNQRLERDLVTERRAREEVERSVAEGVDVLAEQAKGATAMYEAQLLRAYERAGAAALQPDLEAGIARVLMRPDSTRPGVQPLALQGSLDAPLEGDVQALQTEWRDRLSYDDVFDQQAGNL